MTKEELIRNLKYTMKKHENDRVGTFETNISLMCKDILDYLEQEPCDKCVYSTKDGYCQYDDITETIPPLTSEEMQKCKAIVKKYIPKQEPCEDCISRQYLLDNCVVDKVTMPYVPISKIENAPPVTPQPKYGKWIGYNYPAHECVYCSNCKTEYYEEDLYLGGSKFPKFCPNCGAKMQESEE